MWVGERAPCWWVIGAPPLTSSLPPGPAVQMTVALSPCRPGDRIMLVDDSNEDWWKVSVNGAFYLLPEVFLCKPALSPFCVGGSTL